MKVRIQKITDLIEFPEEDFATLMDFDNDGMLTYKIKYLAKPSKLLKRGSPVIKIRFIQEESRDRNVPVFRDGFEPERIVENLLENCPRQKDLREQKENLIIKEFNSDITKKISNTIAGNLLTSPSSDDLEFQAPISVEPVSVNELEERGANAPVLEANLFRPREGQGKEGLTNSEIKEGALSLIVNRGVDPAVYVGGKSNTILPAQKMLQGYATNTPYTSMVSFERSAIENELQNSLLIKKNIANQEVVSTKNVINVITKKTTTFITVEEIVKIPAGDLNFDNFILEAEAVSENDKQKLQKIRVNVPHQENLAAFYIPSLAPKLSVVPRLNKGKNIITVTQMDNQAASIGIYRRIIPMEEADIETGYTHLTDVEVASGTAPEVIEDRMVSSNPVIYRAIPVSTTGILGGEFSGQVVKSLIPLNLTKKFKRRNNNITLSHEIEFGAIRLIMDNLVSGPVALELQKRELTNKQQSFTRIGNTILLDPEPLSTIEVVDRAVKNYRIYEYRCKYFYRDGSEEVANNSIIVEYTPIQSNILNLVISLPSILQDENGIDVTFSITKDVIPTSMDIIKSFLEAQGFETEFEDDIEANREKLQSLFLLRVIRTNMVTGEEEDFGIIDSTEFSDRKYGSPKGVKPIQAGLLYKYAVISHARSPETLFPTATREVTTQNSTYTLRPYKWLHPITLIEGNIVTDKSLLRNHSKNTFTFGEVVDIQYLEADLRETLPTVLTIKAEVLRKRTAILRWKTQGDTSKIDHFIVILETLGLRTIVGKSHAISSSNEFVFIDHLDNSESGVIQYILIPVYYDFSRGVEFRSNQIVI